MLVLPPELTHAQARASLRLLLEGLKALPPQASGVVTVDASALSIKTNVGTTLPKDGNGNFDCTIKSSETIRLSVSGTDAAAAWAVADASVLSISADGLITPAKVGTTTVTATVGGAVLTITVRIK